MKLKYNPGMPKLIGLENIVTELREERKHLENNLRHVDAALAVLGKLEGGKFATESRRSETVSIQSRRRMAAAQRARSAKVKQHSGTSNTPLPKGKPMSVEVKAKLRAAYAASHPGWKPKKK